MKYLLKILLITFIITSFLPFENGAKIKNPGTAYAETADLGDVMLLAQATAVSDATAIPDSADVPPPKPIRIELTAPPTPSKPERARQTDAARLNPTGLELAFGNVCFHR